MLVSIAKAAEILGVSISTLRNWDRNGTLKPLRTPGNTRRYDTNDLDEFVKNMRGDKHEGNLQN